MPGGLDIVLLFHSKLCEDEWTKRFLQNLQEMLRPLEFEQHCKLQLTGTSCFPSLSDPPNEFIIQVQLKGNGRSTTAGSPGHQGGGGVG